MEFIRENILKIITIIVVFIVVIVLFTIFSGAKGGSKIKTYSQLEERLVSSAKKYLNDNPKLVPSRDGETIKVNLDTLVNAEYIDKIYSIEDENIECSGYVQVVYNNESNDYIPYIKCGKYYETKTIADYIKGNEQISTTDDGLYQNGDKYVFKGENPNNYLKLGERIYRIIEINNKNELRLISTEKYSNYIVWDDRYNIERDRNDGINDYSKSRLKDSLENIYTDSEFFSKQEKEKIIEHNVCIGKKSINDYSIDGSVECSAEYPNQRVSLLQLNEYARASIDPNCKDTNSKSCSNYNYFESINSVHRTITAVLDNTYQVYYISDGIVSVTRAASSFSIYPVVYIDSSSIYNSGNGTLEKPYVVR
ncbi:MAG: hypothetical protein J6J17_00705 [Bacilli bacterium]|nr:hypothetical protein [Bacilli bacterium]